MKNREGKFSTSNFISNNEMGILFDNTLRIMTDEQLKELFMYSKFPTNEDFMALIDSKMNKNDTFDKEYILDLLEAYFHHDKDLATSWVEAERERRLNEAQRKSNEVKRQEEFACIKECVVYVVENNIQSVVFNRDVYPAVAAKINSKVANVEKSMRDAIKKARLDHPECFKVADERFKHLTVVGFLSYLIEKVRMNLLTSDE